MSNLRSALYPLLLTLTGIAILGWAASANASEEKAQIRAAHDRLEHALYEAADLCPTKVDPSIREYLFIFEGAGGYAPARAILQFPDLHTKVQLGRAALGRNWNGAAPNSLPTDSHGRDIFPSDWSREKIALYRLVNEAQEEDGDGSMLDLLDYAASYYRSYPKRVLYYDFLTPGKAAECARSLKKLYASARRPIAFSAAGFSLGGYATVRFARKLHASQIRLKNVFTIDPVPYTHEAIRAIDGRRNGTVIQVPDNHDHWLNIHQRRDENALQTIFGDIPIRGARIGGKVTNRIPRQYDRSEVPRHMAMPNSDVAVAEMKRILEQE